MADKSPGSSLSVEQAAKLLAPVGPVSVLGVSIVATTNDVFKITTRDHGNFYVKFHTARWYADQPDTYFVVERECAMVELLRKRGMPLPYRAWADYTRTVVPRSVYICAELAGIPVPEAIATFPGQRDQILQALGRYLRQLHNIEFSTPGLLAFAHAYFAADATPIPPVFSWDQHPIHHAKHLQRDALDVLDSKAESLPVVLVPELKAMFGSLADTVKNDYAPPRLTVGNCHAWHFHVDQTNGIWKVLGFYDFEAGSAGDATIDLVELEVTLTPSLNSTAWRGPFFEAYGSRPGFEGYKRRLLYYLLFEVGNPPSRMIPDPQWFNDRLANLIHASDWEQLEWYFRGAGGQVRQSIEL
jgi:aminoglycoside phosphotransferase (APT) family kinase protein